MYRKNTAGQFVHFQGVDSSTGGIKSGVTWTIRRCIDGTFAAGGGTVTEDGTAGWYKFAMAQADTNGNNIGFNFTGTGAVPQTVNILTDGSPPDVNLKNAAGTAVTLDANNVLNVSTKYVGGTLQTARDIGLSVLVGDKTGFSLSAAGVQAIWDALTSALTTVGSIGKLLVDNINATISSRLASASYTAPDNASITGIKAKTDNLPASPAAVSDIPTAAQNATAVLTTQMTESYPALHAAPTLAQSQFEMRGLLAEKGVAGTTLTTKKVDGSTTAETFTLNDATAPTAITRAS